MKSRDEWYRQAQYDMDTAQAMFDSGRYIYAIFMSHLSLEKALKGYYSEHCQELPPKTHNLLFLTEKASLKLPQEFADFVFLLNRVSIPTRYPDDLTRLQTEYNREKTLEWLRSGKKVLSWLTRQ